MAAEFKRHARLNTWTPCFKFDGLARGSGRFYGGGIRVTADRKSFARQSILARMTGMAQSTINRQLHRLHDAGQIALEIQGRQTRIAVLSSRPADL